MEEEAAGTLAPHRSSVFSIISSQSVLDAGDFQVVLCLLLITIALPGSSYIVFQLLEYVKDIMDLHVPRIYTNVRSKLYQSLQYERNAQSLSLGYYPNQKLGRGLHQEVMRWKDSVLRLLLAFAYPIFYSACPVTRHERG